LILAGFNGESGFIGNNARFGLKYPLFWYFKYQKDDKYKPFC